MSRVTDLRLNVDFPDHPKTLALESALGSAGPWALVRLFGWCARFRETGDLRAFLDEEIEAFARWTGEKGRLISELIRLGWLEGSAFARRIHDWTAHQGWVAGADARARAARKAAWARWHPGEPFPEEEIPCMRSALLLSGSDPDLSIDRSIAVDEDKVHALALDIASEFGLELPEATSSPSPAEPVAASSVDFGLPSKPEVPMGHVADDMAKRVEALRAAKAARDALPPAPEPEPAPRAQEPDGGLAAMIARMSKRCAEVQAEGWDPARPDKQAAPAGIPFEQTRKPPTAAAPFEASKTAPAVEHSAQPVNSLDAALGRPCENLEVCGTPSRIEASKPRPKPRIPDVMVELPAMRRAWDAILLPATGRTCPGNGPLTRALAEKSAAEWEDAWRYAATRACVRGIAEGRTSPYRVDQLLNSLRTDGRGHIDALLDGKAESAAARAEAGRERRLRERPRSSSAAEGFGAIVARSAVGIAA